LDGLEARPWHQTTTVNVYLAGMVVGINYSKDTSIGYFRLLCCFCISLLASWLLSMHYFVVVLDLESYDGYPSGLSFFPWLFCTYYPCVGHTDVDITMSFPNIHVLCGRLEISQGRANETDLSGRRNEHPWDLLACSFVV